LIGKNRPAAGALQVLSKDGKRNTLCYQDEILSLAGMSTPACKGLGRLLTPMRLAAHSMIGFQRIPLAMYFGKKDMQNIRLGRTKVFDGITTAIKNELYVIVDCPFYSWSPTSEIYTGAVEFYDQISHSVSE
jgi:hypothetical protein